MGSRKIFSLFGSIAIEGISKSKEELAAFDKDVKKATHQLNMLGKELTNTGKALSKGVTAPVVALGASMLVLADNTAKYTDKLLDLQQITGLSTDNLQGLEDVARVAGVEFDSLASNASKLTAKMPEIINGTGMAGKALQALGVSAFDSNGNIRDMNVLFPEIINKLQGMENATDRNVLAQKIFGEDLKALAPVLGMTAEQFNGMLNGVKDTAGYMSKEALAAADAYRIKTEELKDQFGGLTRDISMAFIPVLQDTLIPLIEGVAVPVFKGLANAIKGISDWFVNLPGPLKEAMLVFGGVLTVAGPTLLLFGKFIPIIKTLVPLFMALTKGQIALNVAMTANPIGLIVAGVAALITAGYLLIRNWETVKTAFINVWGAIKFNFANAVDAIKLGFLEMEVSLSKTFQSISKWIPGANKFMDEHIGKVEESIAAIAAQRDARKLDREETKAQTAMTKEQTAAVKEAQAVTTQYNMDLLKNKKVTKEVKEETEALTEVQKEQNNNWDAAADFVADYTKRFEDETFTREQLLEREKNLALEKATEMGQGTYEVLKYYEVLKRKLDKETADKAIEEAKKVRDAKIKTGSDIVMTGAAQLNALAEVGQKFTELELERIDSRLQADIAAVNASRLNEEDKLTAIENLNALADKERKELQKKQARRDKALAIFNIGIATAQGIMQAFQLGPIAGAIFAGIIAAIGIAQTAVVAAKPIPLAKGGLVESDPGKGVIAQIGEGSQDELVLPMKTGAAELADNIMAKIGTGSGAMSMGQTIQQNISLHIGTLIADNFGLKELERKLQGIRVAEAQRTGFAYGTA